MFYTNEPSFFSSLLSIQFVDSLAQRHSQISINSFSASLRIFSNLSWWLKTILRFSRLLQALNQPKRILIVQILSKTSGKLSSHRFCSFLSAKKEKLLLEYLFIVFFSFEDPSKSIRNVRIHSSRRRERVS